MPKILLANVQSLKPKLDELRIIASNTDLDLICLTETWLSSEIESSLLNIEGYTLIRNDRSVKRGGGTAVYVRDELYFVAIDTENQITNAIEASFVDLPTINLSILCVYIPPQLNAANLATVREDVASALDQHLNCLHHSCRRVIILGDFNHFDTELSASDLNLSDIIMMPTRGQNILDHILISDNLKDVYPIANVSYEAPIGNSDHLTLVLTPTNTQLRLNDFRRHTVFDYRSKHLAKLLDNAMSLNWTNLLDGHLQVDAQWRLLHERITSLMNQSLPTKVVYLTSKDKPWMTPITELIINQKWLDFRSKDWDSFSLLKTKARAEIAKAKLIWTEKLKATTYGLWQVVRHHSGKCCTHELTGLIKQMGSAQNLAETIASSMEQGTKTSNTPAVADEEWTLHISESEVLSSLCALNPRKSMGSDNIPNRIYSLLAPFIAGPLKTIFENSISQRTFPEDWKNAIVVPIPKTHPPTIEKLRTISLLPTPAKILEKLVLKSSYKHLEKFFGPHQHAFRKSASTTTALVELADNWTRLFDDTTLVGSAVLSLDFSKAFDKVDHSVLLQKMFDSGLSGGFILWLSSYLTERSYRVKICGSLSSNRQSYVGVPQGSVLGPALFSFLVGDIPLVRDTTFLTQYADDANILLSFRTKNPDAIHLDINEQLSRIRDWCTLNKQELNVGKSKLMLSLRTQLLLKDLPAPTVRSLKVLGVCFNSRLTWDDHIEMLCRKAYQRMHILRTLKPFTTKEEIHDVYLAIIRSMFDYCCPVFVSLPDKLRKRIRRVEVRAHRIIFGDRLNCECNFDGLQRRREKLSLNLLDKILSNQEHLLHGRLPRSLSFGRRLANFPCRTNKRLHSFFPFTTLLHNKRAQRK